MITTGTKSELIGNVQPGDKVYLDASDITITWPSRKLSHKHLGHFLIEQKVGKNAYHLRLPRAMSCIHPVFNIIKLTPALEDPITGWHITPSPIPEIINGEEEWVVEEILDSKMMNQKPCYLIKWKDFGVKHNSWEPWNNVHAQDSVTENILAWWDTSEQWKFRSNLPQCQDATFLKRGWM